jgi:hypothetical protein
MTKCRCKLCEEILSPIENSIISCFCGEITLDGMIQKVICKTSADAYEEIDELGNVLVVRQPTRREELLRMLDEMVKAYEDLPESGKLAPITNYDLASALLLVSSILRS